ncbi:hypothetical protein F383_01723 [Gossypium arboreum]|uniref:Uncharacterized protein n=1 Tax=Gossypium arboreum TaxID=29729 RepID=A0A0B0N4W3_GOSAR|nr:hypothetical protein F383_01723 [Gossypium arboreum]
MIGTSKVANFLAINKGMVNVDGVMRGRMVENVGSGGMGSGD